MRVMHVIIGLHVGGAEMMLLKLLRHLDRSQFENQVVALTDGGSVADSIRALDIPVHHLGLGGVENAAAVLWRLRKLSRHLAPTVIQGWMYHGNIAATLAARWSPGTPTLYWNIRHSLSDPGREKFLTRRLIELGGRWSDQPCKVLHNSEISIEQHARAGFNRDNALMVPNGFDLEAFAPRDGQRARLRADLGLEADTPLVGTLGRHHPMKGQEDFIRAAAVVAAQFPAAHFVMAGRGVTPETASLGSLVTKSGLTGRVHLIGSQAQPANYLAGLDVFCLSSTHGEGFPNVLGEAMACGVPCVTTEVAEAPRIVGQWGEVVPVADPPALAKALGRMLAKDDGSRRELGLAARESIRARYEISDITARYAEIYSAAG